MTSRCLSLLEKCKTTSHLKQAHANAITCGLATNSYALSRLLSFCSNPQIPENLTHAHSIFTHIQNPTICIFNTMLKAFFLNNHFINTIDTFSRIFHYGLTPDHYTFPYVFKACAKLGSCFLGEMVHGCGLKFGFCADGYVGNGLLGMYVGFGNMVGARNIFDGMSRRDVVSSTVMISGYAKAGEVEMARAVFDEVEVKDRGVWGAMVSGYVYNNCFKEGLVMFRLMQLDGFEPDEGVFVSVLCACANMGALDVGIWVHRYLDKVGMRLGVRLRTALIDIYAKCGCLDVAKRLFDGVQERDVVCWNAMLSGMAMHGDGVGALEVFKEMEESGVRPDDITFVGVVTACSHSGLAREGLQVAERMWSLYIIEPKSEHYGCIIDLLSRAGRLEEATELIRRMPSTVNPSEEAVVWRALLSACCSHRRTDLAEVAAKRLVQLERHSGAYVLLSNLYAASGKHDEARDTRSVMKSRGVDKVPGCSSIEIDGIVSEFVAGEKIQPQMEATHALLENMSNQMGFSELNLYQLQPDVPL